MDAFKTNLVTEFLKIESLLVDFYNENGSLKTEIEEILEINKNMVMRLLTDSEFEEENKAKIVAHFQELKTTFGL